MVSLNMDFYSKILYQNLFLVLVTLFASVSIYLFIRLKRGVATFEENSEFYDVLPDTTTTTNLVRSHEWGLGRVVYTQTLPLHREIELLEEIEKESDNVKVEEELVPKFEAFDDVVENVDSEKNGDMLETEFCFKFKFPTYEEFSKNKKENMWFQENVCDMKHVVVSDEESKTKVRSEKEEEIEEMKYVKGELDFSDELLFQSEKDFSSSTDSDTVSIGFEHMRSLMSRLVGSYSDGFLSDEDFGGEFELDSLNGIDSELKNLGMSEENLEFEDSDSDVMEEYRKLEQENFLSHSDFHEDMDKAKSVEFVKEDDKLVNVENFESRNATVVETYEDSNKLESLWEHQELIEQLKMEIRKVRATGLPTILEESESPTMDDLQPWKINEMLQREDCMSELHKFYKSYRERMRKFDILTYQKMYAIGYLQKDPLKDPLELLFNQKSSGPSLISLVSQNIRLFKHKSDDIVDPMVKFIKELQSDLEVVYVGQMCLSWEFLHWQYMKALNLWDSDPRGIRKYHEVAGEFQQFQVLMQRFIENEPFQGPRVQYFIKTRYDLRNLLQVPVIRDDRRNKAKTREKSDYLITGDMLVEILEESIRIFWRFVRADKDCYSVTGKGPKGIHPEVQEQEDLELLLEIRKNLEKKEKKLQDVLRSGNCILRRFRKQRGEDSDHVLYFFSQVDMKLVARVLNMSRLTKDQLVWCHNKLSRISFAHRKIHVEPSFLLFPC